MKLLAIEAATEACSAAVLIDGEVIEQYQVAPRQHNELLLPMCEKVLAESEVSLTQLDAIAFGCGPGAFTGVRIAAGVAQGIAFAHDLPAVSISTLANLACQVDTVSDELVLPAIDARMNEVYWAVYRKKSDFDVELVVEEKVQAPEMIEVNAGSIVSGLGSGWGTYFAILQKKTRLDQECINAEALPRAKVTALLGRKKVMSGEMLGASNILPVYLRNNVTYQK
ncbi:MAG: tRNA (adenosine(37)-N6)-threonylcarbamoyltransferase complex dimerization subunit type 1 TsaB [Pseudomonadota bacterium]